MQKKAEKGQTRRPKGLTRLVFRLPLLLYRANLGWILGDRFMLLVHTGRRSGRSHKTVLEVVRADPAEGVYIIAAGFGETTDWFQNLLHSPEARIIVGGNRREVIAERLCLEETVKEFENYAAQHPRAFRALAGFFGFNVTGAEEDFISISGQMPMILLRSVQERESLGPI